MIARYGGEEFAVLLLDADLQNGQNVAEAIRCVVNESKFGLENGNEVEVTISVGVATMKNDKGDFDSIVRAADKALYIAKEEGRNRVVVAEH